MKYIIDIKGEIEGDYEIIGKYEERPMGERKPGKWIKARREGCLSYSSAYAECSECGGKIYMGWKMKFCPNCGSDMRGNQDENN